jgi:iron complex outermembrane receptor protein
MEYGANTLGGAINLVSMQPKSKISVQALLGMASGKSYEYGLNLGSKWNKFFVQASYYNAQNQDLPLSKKYTATAHENGDLRDNSYSADNKLNLKLGFTPNTNNEFTLNYVYQNGEKGTPPYSGTDANIKTRYWQWPHWDKQSLYFISNSKISASTDLKIRVYYDQFYNELKSFDDSTYSSITKPYAFTSIYNDNGYGGNAVLSTTAFANNLLKLSMHYKTDMHREHNIGEPIRHFADNTLSVGIDDNYSFKDKWQLISGFSFNNRTSLLAQEYNAITETLSDFPKNNNSALNAQLAIDYKFNQASNILFYVAERTRFATMKDRYSYRLGKAIPNPDLKAEQALHYNITYKALLFNKLSFDISAYYIKLNNTIQQVDNVQPGIYQMQNTGKALFKGFDFSANYAIVSILNIFGSYSYLERENSSHPEILFTDVPVHKVMAQITLKPIQNLEFSFSEQNNSKRYSTSYGTYAKAFNLLGIDASYKLKQFSFYAGIDNILDENYEYSEGYPAEGRNFFLKILYHFNK